MDHLSGEITKVAGGGWWQSIRTWGEMVKFSHSVFALPFALVATFLAGSRRTGGLPSMGQVGLIVVCMIAARSFAMTINRIVDAAIDARNPRTAMRPIPAGRISRGRAVLFAFMFAALFLAGCFGFQHWFQNPWPTWLALPTLAALAAYSYCKRFTSLAHFVLGGVIGFAPLAAWIAIHPVSIGLPAVLLTAAVMTWIAGFDLIYACQDVAVDRAERLFSIPSRMGVPFALTLSRVCHVLTVAGLVALGRVEHVGWLYWSGVAITVLLLIIEQAMVRPADLSRVTLAFFTVNGVVSLVFAGAAIGDLLLRR